MDDSKIIMIENAKTGPARYFFNSLQWVIKAKDTEVQRGFHYLHIEDGIFTATNGYRMHTYFPILEPAVPCPDGDYEVIQNTKKLIVLKPDAEYQYPTWWRVYDIRKAKRLSTFMGLGMNGAGLSFFVHHIIMNTGMCFQLEYLKDIYMGEVPIEMEVPEGTDTLVLSSEDRLGIVRAISK